MSAPPCVAEVKVESYVFPATAKPPGTAKTLILGGAGARGLNIDGKFVKFTAIGVYLEADAVPSLAVKWNGKSAEELTDSVQFFRDIVTGPFEKLTRITMILPLSGKQYSEKVSENCVAFWKAAGIYGDAESKAIEKFNDVFSDQMFPPGASIFFTQSPLGSLTISFSKDGSMPEIASAVIENKPLSEAVLESIIGVKGVSPEAKQSLAVRLSELFKNGINGGDAISGKVGCENDAIPQAVVSK
ncbi:chalcone--flavonone isomerase [Ipomoea triloba]|uniref:chalcone--flavonone isomerase n=1 Tax=Ipomoea triloba TaxID=35885 RepID=UPI00125D5550|nr:chalcone--flavonone isomerase [Ipomoea triloba]